MGYFDIKRDESRGLTLWMLGYITAANGYLPQGNLLRVRSWKESLDWMGDYCRLCPFDNIGRGMQIFVLELQEAFADTASKPTKIPRTVQAKEGCGSPPYSQ